MDETLRIHLFGRLDVTRGERSVDGLHRRHADRLLACLLLTGLAGRRGQVFSQETGRLQDELRLSDDSLRQALTTLRKCLEGDAWRLTVRTGSVLLDLRDVSVDLVDFLTTARSTDSLALERAIQTYHQGELLAGWNAEVPGFQKTITELREQMRELYGQALSRRIAAAFDQDQDGFVLFYGEQLLTLARDFPRSVRVDDETWASLMQCYFDRGRFQSAYALYQAYVDILYSSRRTPAPRLSHKLEALKKRLDARTTTRDAAGNLPHRREDLEYALALTVAQQAIEDNNIHHALKLLNRHLPGDGHNDPSGFEWRYLKRRCGSEGFSQSRFLTRGIVLAVAVSPDGSRLVTAASKPGGRGATLWDTATLKEIRSLPGPPSAFSVVFSPDGRLAAVGYSDGTLSLFETDADTPPRAWRVAPGRGVPTEADVVAAFSPDGRMIATGGRRIGVALWDTATGAKIRELPDEAGACVACLAFSRDGRYVYGGADHRIRIWETATGARVQTLTGHSEQVCSLVVSPDGKWIASGGADNVARLWDAATHAEVRALRGHRDRLYSLAFTPDSRFLVTGSGDESIGLWDIHDQRVLRRMNGHRRAVRAVAFYPYGNILYSGAEDGTLRVWHIHSDRPDVLRAHDRKVNALRFSPDDCSLVSCASDGRLLLLDIADGSERCALRLRPHDIAYSAVFTPDGQRLITGGRDGSITIWDTVTGKRLGEWSAHTQRVSCLALTPDGCGLVSGSWDGIARLWARTEDATGFGKTPLTLRGHTDRVHAVAFASPLCRIATGGDDHALRVWDAHDGSCLFTRDCGAPVSGIAFSPDGALIATADDTDTVRLWDARDGSPLLTLEGHGNGVECVAFSPDGTRVVSGSRDGLVKLWHVTSGHCLLTLRPEDGWVSTLAFSHSGGALATGTKNGTIRLWYAE